MVCSSLTPFSFDRFATDRAQTIVETVRCASRLARTESVRAGMNGAQDPRALQARRSVKYSLKKLKNQVCGCGCGVVWWVQRVGMGVGVVWVRVRLWCCGCGCGVSVVWLWLWISCGCGCGSGVVAAVGVAVAAAVREREGEATS